MKKDILVVDDEEYIVNVVKSYLEESNYTVYTAFDGNQALEQFDEVFPSLIILDPKLPEYIRTIHVVGYRFGCEQ